MRVRILGKNSKPQRIPLKNLWSQLSSHYLKQMRNAER